jgi:hypothetical protein
MKRILLVLASFALVVAACSGSADGGSSDTSAANTAAGTVASSTIAQEPSSDTSEPTPSSTEAPTTSSEAKPPPEGPPARDFTLALEPSGEFVLSQEVKPVYMIFWAEW